LGTETDFVFIRTGENAHSFEKQCERANLFLSERRPDLAKEGKGSYFNKILYIFLNPFSCTFSVLVLLYSAVSLKQKFRLGVYDNTSCKLTINM
jgi:hypothetical protein